MANNKLIEEQLAKVNYADLTNYDKKTNTYHIPKNNKKVFCINKSYLIELSDYLLEDTNSLLQTNYNNGKIPNTKYYRAEIEKIINNNIYIIGVGCNQEGEINHKVWEGYLPIKDVKIIKEL